MISEKRKQYDIDNQEKIRKQRIVWDINNAEKIKKQHNKYGKGYRIKNANKLKQYRIDNKEKIKQYACNSPESRKKIDKKYRMNNKIKIREYKINKRYGISLDEVHQILDRQKGKCAICGTHQDELNKTLAIDHNHESNKVRGLLCDKCNRGLGHFNDDITLLEQAINYLKNNL